MFSDLPKNQRDILTSEQNAIINSTELNIIVSASPGCGKTYTLVEKIKKDYPEKTEKFGFVACSFTREASKQLENKLSKDVNLSLSFVGTIDAFVLTVIINPFKNRCLQHFLNSSILDRNLIITMPNFGSKSNEITKIGKSHLEVDSYYQKWISDFKLGKYEISYCAYLLALNMINNMPEVKSFISSRYTCIYVDEAQDLNEFQHDLIKGLKDTCGLKTFLIGDKNQSIYEFRGARPALFSSLANSEFINYPISISVRCHKSIMDFSNLFLDDSAKAITNSENKVNIYDNYSTSMLDDIISTNDNILWISDTNDLAQIFFNYSLSKNLEFKYTKPLELSDANFIGTYYNLLEELLSFYFNYQNSIAALSYSIEDIELTLEDYITEKSFNAIKKKVIDVSISPKDYIFSIFTAIGINISEVTLNEIEQQLKNSVCSEHYLRTNDKKRIMTIHSAKGLEAHTVIVFIDYDDYFYNTYPNDREAKMRAYYVAFSRAEKELHIFFRTSKLDKYGQKRTVNQQYIRTKIKQSFNRIIVE
jgi:superfamily I DNA/RNA helicase